MKIEAVIPEGERNRIEETKIFAPTMELSDQDRSLIDILERAIETRDTLTFSYRDEKGKETHRNAQPLGLWFWGRKWTLVAWCEMRNDFRMFRIDRMNNVQVTDIKFKPTPERSLAKFLKQIEAQYGPQL